MTDPDDNGIQLSRRKVLAGLGTIGVASAGAGLGTTAWLSDEESFLNNVFTAGTLDLSVDYYVDEDQGNYAQYQVSSFGPGAPPAIDGDNHGVRMELDDVKPGDNGRALLCFTIDDNPAYLWTCGALTENAENGVNEPESDADGEDDPYGAGSGDDWSGELAENVDVTLSYCDFDADGDVVWGTNPDGSAYADNPIFDGTLEGFLTELSTGLALDGEGADRDAGSQSPYDGTNNAAGGDFEPTNPCLCLEWDVPTSVENEIQSDSVAFDLVFTAIQSRHNDGSANPCCEAATIDLSTGTADWRVLSTPTDADFDAPAVVTDRHPRWTDADCAEFVDPYDNGAQTSDPVGDYVYEVEFLTTRGDCTLDLRYSADNPVEFFLDGSSIVDNDTSQLYASLEGPVSVQVGAVGSHTLRAVVTNEAGSGSNPTGLLACAQVNCTCPDADGEGGDGDGDGEGDQAGT